MWPVPSLPGRGSSLEWFAQDSRGEEISQDHFQGRAQCPAASCRLHGRCGAGVTLCATHPGRPWRFLEARHWGHTGPPVTPPEYGCGLGPRRHQETRQGATSVGSHMPRDRLLGARPCPSFLRPTLRLSGPHRATSTAHEAVSCCVWGMRAVRHVHDINPRGGKGEEVLVGQVFI